MKNVKKSIRKNYVYNVLYQVIAVITPFITAPYIARILGAERIGIYSYIESITSCFVLFANFGIPTYGQREISYNQDKIEQRSIIFWEIKILQLVISLFCLAVFLAYGYLQKNPYLYFIFSFNILAVIADVNWFFQGMEEFGKIVSKNIIMKILGVVYIFIFVKSKNDLGVYIFGITFFMFASNLSLWTFLYKYIKKIKWKNIHPFKRFIPALGLFIPTIAIQIYTVLDKTMIGMITKSAFENGYYEQAIKLSKMTLMFVVSLGTVMIPRISYLYEKGETSTVLSFMYRGYRFVWFLGTPLCFGLIGISTTFVPWFYGPGYDKVSPLLSILSFLILAIGINNVTGVQYLIPTQRQILFTKSVLIGAITNLVLNIILIRYYGSIGAAISSVIAETVIAVVQLYDIRKELSSRIIINSSKNYLIMGIIMLIILLVEGKYFTKTIASTLFMIVSGGSVYLLGLYFIKDEFFMDNIRLINRKIRYTR